MFGSYPQPEETGGVSIATLPDIQAPHLPLSQAQLVKVLQAGITQGVNAGLHLAVGVGRLSWAKNLQDSLQSASNLPITLYGVEDITNTSLRVQRIVSLQPNTPLADEWFLLAHDAEWGFLFVAHVNPSGELVSAFSSDQAVVARAADALGLPHAPTSAHMWASSAHTAHFLHVLMDAITTPKQLTQLSKAMAVPVGLSWVLANRPQQRWDFALRALRGVIPDSQVTLYYADDLQQKFIPVFTTQPTDAPQPNSYLEAALATTNLVRTPYKEGHLIAVPVLIRQHGWGCVAVTHPSPALDAQISDLVLLVAIVAQAIERYDLPPQYKVPPPAAPDAVAAHSIDANAAPITQSDAQSSDDWLESEYAVIDEAGVYWPELEEFARAGSILDHVRPSTLDAPLPVTGHLLTTLTAASERGGGADAAPTSESPTPAPLSSAVNVESLRGVVLDEPADPYPVAAALRVDEPQAPTRPAWAAAQADAAPPALEWQPQTWERWELPLNVDITSASPAQYPADVNASLESLASFASFLNDDPAQIDAQPMGSALDMTEYAQIAAEGAAVLEGADRLRAEPADVDFSLPTTAYPDQPAYTAVVSTGISPYAALDEMVIGSHVQSVVDEMKPFTFSVEDYEPQFYSSIREFSDLRPAYGDQDQISAYTQKIDQETAWRIFNTYEADLLTPKADPSPAEDPLAALMQGFSLEDYQDRGYAILQTASGGANDAPRQFSGELKLQEASALHPQYGLTPQYPQPPDRAALPYQPPRYQDDQLKYDDLLKMDLDTILSQLDLPAAPIGQADHDPFFTALHSDLEMLKEHVVDARLLDLSDLVSRSAQPTTTGERVLLPPPALLKEFRIFLSRLRERVQRVIPRPEAQNRAHAHIGQQIMQETDTALEILNDLTRVVNLDEQEVKHFDITTVIREVITAKKHAYAETGTELQWQASNELAVIKGDRGVFSHTLTKLFDGLYELIQGKGLIEVRLQVDSAHATLICRLQPVNSSPENLQRALRLFNDGIPQRSELAFAGLLLSQYGAALTIDLNPSRSQASVSVRVNLVR